MRKKFRFRFSSDFWFCHSLMQTQMFCDSNRDGTWGSIWGIIRIGCRGCTRGGTFGDTVSGTWGSTSSRGGIRGGTSWDAQDCH